MQYINAFAGLLAGGVAGAVGAFIGHIYIWRRSRDYRLGFLNAAHQQYPDEYHAICEAATERAFERDLDECYKPEVH